jgi:HK97 family phage prohead protease
VRTSDLQAFRRTFGELGERERRTFPLGNGSKVAVVGNDPDRLKVVGHAAVFNSPSIELRSRDRGSFVEFIAPNAFDTVLRSNPDVVLTWDHDTRYPLARTTAGTLELKTNTHGLRYFGTCSRTTYAEDLRVLMNDGVVSESSFTFTVAKGGEEWATADNDKRTVVRIIHEVGGLYDVCVCVAGAYPATDSGIARSLFLQHGLQTGHLRINPDAALRAAKLRADLELRRRRLRASEAISQT